MSSDLDPTLPVSSNRELLQEVVECLQLPGYSPIQKAALPDLWEGHDVLIQAPTGTGKSLCFFLSILYHLELICARRLASKQTIDATAQLGPSVKSLIVAPTRELAQQLSRALQSIVKAFAISRLYAVNLVGGNDTRHAAQQWGQHAAILIATPGKLATTLEHSPQLLMDARICVLDEFDKLCTAGLLEDVQFIESFLPDALDRQTILSSATYSLSSEARIAEFITHHRQHRIHTSATELVSKDRMSSAEVPASTALVNETMVFRYEPEQAAHKVTFIAALQQHLARQKTLIFCNTKSQVARVHEQLCALGLHTVALHGDLPQEDREFNVFAFSSGCANVLVATDVAARGLDIKGIDVVLHFEVADTAEGHIQRSGRTGRLGQSNAPASIAILALSSALPDIKERLGDALVNLQLRHVSELRFHHNRVGAPVFDLLEIKAGKEQKISKKDIVGAITQQSSVPGEDLGIIQVWPRRSLIAVKRRSSKAANSALNHGVLKSRRVKSRRIRF